MDWSKAGRDNIKHWVNVELVNNNINSIGYDKIIVDELSCDEVKQLIAPNRIVGASIISNI